MSSKIRSSKRKIAKRIMLGRGQHKIFKKYTGGARGKSKKDTNTSLFASEWRGIIRNVSKKGKR